MTHKLERAAGVIVFHQTPEGQRHYLLLQHTSGGHWYFSKGHCEPGESARSAALRELAEETNIRQIELAEGFAERIEYDLPSHGNPPKRKEVLFYLGCTQQEAVRLSTEHDAYAWLSYPEARARLTYDNSRDLLDRAEAFLNHQRER